MHESEKEALVTLFAHSAVQPVASAPGTAKETEAQREGVGPRIRGMPDRIQGPMSCAALTPRSLGRRNLLPISLSRSGSGELDPG